MTKENPADLLAEAVSILDFLCEVLSNLANPHNPDSGLSAHGADGLAHICLHLRGLCQEAVRTD